MSAELFNRSFRPSSDAYLHVARLRSAPAWMMLAIFAVTALLVWLVVITLLGLGDLDPAERVVAIVISAGLGLVALFFLLSSINLIAAAVSRRSWANRQCIAFGPSGVALRLQGAQIDVPWPEVTGVRATYRNEGSRRIPVAVLRVERGREQWDLNPVVLAADPVAVYTFLHFYWTRPDQRAELGTAAAQERMDVYVAARAVGSAPRP